MRSARRRQAQRQVEGLAPGRPRRHVLKALQQRNDLDPALVDDVVMGCVMQVGQQSLNIGRNAVLAAGWPESVPATTVDRQCGSSQQALHFAAQGVIAGAYDVVVAAGVEVMTRTPMGSSVVEELGFPFPKSCSTATPRRGLPPQGIGAEMIADEYGLTREDLDAFGAESQQRAAQATRRGAVRPRDRAGAEASRSTAIDRVMRTTRGSATRPSRPWPTSSRRSRRTARSPPATRRRSPTARRRCWS